MQKAVAQHSQPQNQPAAWQGKGLASESQQQAALASSPRMTAQRKALKAMFGDAVQREANAMETQAASAGEKTGQRSVEKDGNNPAVAKNMAPIQRLISVNASDLYYDKDTLGFEADVSKTKSVKEGEWASNVQSSTGLNPIDITATNFIGMKRMTGWGEFVRGAVKQKLENSSLIFEHTNSTLRSQNDFITNLPNESLKKILAPNDYLTEQTSIKSKYDESLACVLQALINAGASVPNFSAEKGANDYEKFHSYMVKNGYADYDLDHVIYKYYTSIGLALVLNKSTAWKNIRLPKGSYVFTRKGHNFAVTVSNDNDAPDQHIVDDRPQNFTTYLADMPILYVWKV